MPSIAPPSGALLDEKLVPSISPNALPCVTMKKSYIRWNVNSWFWHCHSEFQQLRTFKALKFLQGNCTGHEKLFPRSCTSPEDISMPQLCTCVGTSLPSKIWQLSQIKSALDVVINVPETRIADGKQSNMRLPTVALPFAGFADLQIK